MSLSDEDLEVIYKEEACDSSSMGYKVKRKRGHGVSFRSHQREHEEPQNYLLECQEEAFQLKRGQ